MRSILTIISFLTLLIYSNISFAVTLSEVDKKKLQKIWEDAIDMVWTPQTVDKSNPESLKKLSFILISKITNELPNLPPDISMELKNVFSYEKLVDHIKQNDYLDLPQNLTPKEFSESEENEATNKFYFSSSLKTLFTGFLFLSQPLLAHSSSFDFCVKEALSRPIRSGFLWNYYMTASEASDLCRSNPPSVVFNKIECSHYYYGEGWDARSVSNVCNKVSENVRFQRPPFFPGGIP